MLISMAAVIGAMLILKAFGPSSAAQKNQAQEKWEYKMEMLKRSHQYVVDRKSKEQLRSY